MMKFFKIWSFCMVLFFVGCQENEVVKNKTEAFFSLENYIDKEMNRLEQLGKMTKTINFNGEEEKLEITNPDAKKELEILKQFDINKIVWYDKYGVDSLRDQNNQLVKLTYRAKEVALKTQLLAISFQNLEVSELHIENKTDNFISNSFQTIDYLPKVGYTVDTRQSMKFMEETRLLVDVQFK